MKNDMLDAMDVRVDGLGSTSETGLPTCQIERIAELVYTLLHGGAAIKRGHKVCFPKILPVPH